MINFRPARIATTTAILIMLASSAAVPAMARPIDPDPPIATRKIIFPDSPLRLSATSGSTGNSYGATT